MIVWVDGARLSNGELVGFMHLRSTFDSSSRDCLMRLNRVV